MCCDPNTIWKLLLAILSIDLGLSLSVRPFCYRVSNAWSWWRLPLD